VTSKTFSIRASLLITLLASGAAAQSDATAETLFLDGKKLLADKRYAEACPKFAESARIAPSSGVELALGLCYEAEGKLASAWGAFSAAIPLARRDARHDREKVAQTHVKALEPNISRVTFSVDKATAALPGVELREDGVVLNSAAWTDVPVDPGEHHVEVQAPGYVTYTTSFTISHDATQQAVTIPALTEVPAPVAAPLPVVAPAPSQASHGGSPWRTVGAVTGGVGLAAVIGGSILGVMALGDVNSAQKSCPASSCNNSSAVSQSNTGGTLADASTGLFIAGGALVTAGVLAFILGGPGHSAASGTASTSHGQPVIAPGYVGWRGSF
jgi:hypothetical protein